MVSMLRSKKGIAWGGIFAFLLIIGGVLAFSDTTNKECTKDSQCGENRYCGADFSCHQVQILTIQKTEISTDYTTPAALIAIAIVFAALIVKKRQ